MVEDVIDKTNKNLQESNPQSIYDIYVQKRKIVDFSNKVKKIDNQVKDFLKKNMYNNKKVIVNTNEGKRITKNLFKYLLKKHKKYITNEFLKNDNKERAVADFISGMTDRYAINLHNKIK